MILQYQKKMVKTMEKLKYKPYFALGILLMFLGNIIEVSIFFIIGVLISGGILIYWILMYYLLRPKKIPEQKEEVVEQQQVEDKSTITTPSSVSVEISNKSILLTNL